MTASRTNGWGGGATWSSGKVEEMMVGWSILGPLTSWNGVAGASDKTLARFEGGYNEIMR